MVENAGMFELGRLADVVAEMDQAWKNVVSQRLRKAFLECQEAKLEASIDSLRGRLDDCIEEVAKYSEMSDEASNTYYKRDLDEIVEVCRLEKVELEDELEAAKRRLADVRNEIDFTVAEARTAEERIGVLSSSRVELIKNLKERDVSLVPSQVPVAAEG